MKFSTLTVLLLVVVSPIVAQQDTEFPKEFIMHLKLHNGMATAFKGDSPDLYVGGIQLVPQYTIVAHAIRGGLILDGYYTGKKLQGAIGPTLSFKIKTFHVKPFGSAGNLHLNIDHLWGSEKQRLVGGGINADIGNRLIVGLTVHHDYEFNSWWIQNSIGIRISAIKKKVEDFN